MTLMTHDGKKVTIKYNASCLPATARSQPSVYPPRGGGYRGHQFVDDGDPTMPLVDAMAKGHQWFYVDCGRSIARGQSVWTKCTIAVFHLSP
jgi:hypothetical protein